MRTYIILRQLRLLVKENNERVFKMKDKIIMACLFLVLMAVLPLGFITNNTHSSPEKQPDTDRRGNAFILQAEQFCDNGFCDEAVKALAIIARTNSKSLEKLPYFESNNSDTELYARLEKYFNEESTVLCNKGKPVEIPVCKCTDGSTVSSNTLDYLSPVASPWDLFSNESEKSRGFAGVSASGIEYLCENGMKAEEALKRYLPKLELI